MPGIILNVAEVFCILKRETLVLMTQNKNSYDIYKQYMMYVYYSFLTYYSE